MSEIKKRLVKGYAVVATLTGIATFATHLNTMQKSGFRDHYRELSMYDASFWAVGTALNSACVGAFWPIMIPVMLAYRRCRESE